MMASSQELREEVNEESDDDIRTNQTMKGNG